VKKRKWQKEKGIGVDTGIKRVTEIKGKGVDAGIKSLTERKRERRRNMNKKSDNPI
jgi:hypothetical protein